MRKKLKSSIIQQKQGGTKNEFANCIYIPITFNKPSQACFSNKSKSIQTIMKKSKF